MLTRAIRSLPGSGSHNIWDVGNWSIGKQHGGPLRAGQLALVGERGPELFVPRNAGQIVPHGQFGLASGGGGSITFNIMGPGPREIADQVRQVIETMRFRGRL